MLNSTNNGTSSTPVRPAEQVVKMSISPAHGILTRAQVSSSGLLTMDLIGTTLTSLQIMIQALIMTFVTMMGIRHQPRTMHTEQPQAALLQRPVTMESASQVQRQRPPSLDSNSFHAAPQMFVNRTPWVTNANQLTSIPTRGAQVTTGKLSPARAP